VDSGEDIEEGRNVNVRILKRGKGTWDAFCMEKMPSDSR
jgi:hypothetical protein